MDPKDLEMIRDAIKSATEGSVPFPWVTVVIGALVAVIGVLWAWGFKKSESWAIKVEEFARDQRARDDSRDAEIRARYDTVIKKLSVEYDTRIKRLEEARDMARNQYESYRSENENWLRNQFLEAAKVIEESNEIHETATTQIERVIFGRGDKIDP